MTHWQRLQIMGNLCGLAPAPAGWSETAKCQPHHAPTQLQGPQMGTEPDLLSRFRDLAFQLKRAHELRRQVLEQLEEEFERTLRALDTQHEPSQPEAMLLYQQTREGLEDYGQAVQELVHYGMEGGRSHLESALNRVERADASLERAEVQASQARWDIPLVA